jgi:hypothetical protein
MKNIISRYCINPEISFPEYDTDTGELIKTHNYDDFCHLINRWKIILVKKYNAQPGQTIFLGVGPNLYYYSLIFAVAELGLVLIVDWPHVYTEKQLEDPRISMYGQIDYIFIDYNFHNMDHPAAINEWEMRRNLKFGKFFLYQHEFYDYEIPKSEGITDIIKAVWATPDSDLIYSTSSGTIGTPTNIVNSHKEVYMFSNRSANLYFTKNDSALHYKTIHHGSSMSIHFLPAFMVGGAQFTPDGVNGDHIDMDPVIKFVIDKKINQLFLYKPEMLLYFLKNTPKIEHKVDITTLQQITPEMISLIKEKNINCIRTSFGDTTIGLMFFIKTVDQTTIIDEYDVNNMGPVLDDFYQFEIRDDHLWISIPALQQDWKTSNDVFAIIDGSYHFKGRSHKYRINEEWVELARLEQMVLQLFGLSNANIVIDSDQQKIYLAVWVPNLEAENKLKNYLTDTYNGAANISYILRNENRDEFASSRKIDNVKIRMVCREKLNLIAKE